MTFPPPCTEGGASQELTFSILGFFPSESRDLTLMNGAMELCHELGLEIQEQALARAIRDKRKKRERTVPKSTPLLTTLHGLFNMPAAKMGQNSVGHPYRAHIPRLRQWVFERIDVHPTVAPFGQTPSDHPTALHPILESRQRRPATLSPIPRTIVTGSQLSRGLFEDGGFGTPLLLLTTEGTGLSLSSNISSLEYLVGALGPDYVIPVIDVAKQEAEEMTLSDFAGHWRQEGPGRKRTLNVLGLNVSDTAVAREIQLPTVVREIGWAQSTTRMLAGMRRGVDKYVLFSMKGSFTDFHVDFGGSSVWYNLVRGRKIFYLVPPTDTNLRLFGEWRKNAGTPSTFFGDMVQDYYEMTLEAGEMAMIPGGWIHAVWTPIDSVAIGGNFLHTFGVKMQVLIMNLEDRLGEGEEFVFPGALDLAITAGERYLDRLVEQSPPTTMSGSPTMSSAELEGVHMLATFLKNKDSPSRARRWQRLEDAVGRRLSSL